MAYSNLINAVSGNLNRIAEDWAGEVKKSPHMQTYKKFSDEEITSRAKRVYQHLMIWLENGAGGDEVEKYFTELGATRLEEGFTLNEVHYALYVTKKLLWNSIDWRDAVSGTFTNDNTTRIMSVFNDYFDLGNFFVTRGYFKALINKLDESKRFAKSELENILLKGSIDWEKFNEDEFIWRPV